jgi:hypothetical protein
VAAALDTRRVRTSAVISWVAIFADAEEKALENTHQFMWMAGEFTCVAHPVWGNPAGYYSPSQRQMFVKMVAGRPETARATGYAAPFEQQVAELGIVGGTPKTVIEKLKIVLEAMQTSILALWPATAK